MKQLTFKSEVLILLLIVVGRFIFHADYSTAFVISICLIALGYDQFLMLIREKKELKDKAEIEQIKERMSKVERLLALNKPAPKQ